MECHHHICSVIWKHPSWQCESAFCLLQESKKNNRALKAKSVYLNANFNIYRTTYITVLHHNIVRVTDWVLWLHICNIRKVVDIQKLQTFIYLICCKYKMGIYPVAPQHLHLKWSMVVVSARLPQIPNLLRVGWLVIVGGAMMAVCFGKFDNGKADVKANSQVFEVVLVSNLPKFTL